MNSDGLLGLPAEAVSPSATASSGPATPSVVEQERALAAEVFPFEWKRALSVAGERGRRMRANLRRRAATTVAIAALRAQGRSCATCKAFNRGSFGSGNKSYCEDDTDFQGYALIQASDVCTDWREPKAVQP